VRGYFENRGMAACVGPPCSAEMHHGKSVGTSEGARSVSILRFHDRGGGGAPEMVILAFLPQGPFKLRGTADWEGSRGLTVWESSKGKVG